jgi:glycosyltransferase involved in cell wall biosynthesis
VLPSLWEGLPMALVEAGACGLAAVATRVGGVPEVVEDGRTGLLLSPANSEALAGAILRLLADPALRAELGSRARGRVREHFGTASMVRYIESLYTDLLEASV